MTDRLQRIHLVEVAVGKGQIERYTIPALMRLGGVNHPPPNGFLSCFFRKHPDWFFDSEHSMPRIDRALPPRESRIRRPVY